ncbi:hypothetical protein L596_014998 [Steinernema carpocapsae]|uniref:Uncharacterized protein n=1 Tax=Steinernema carpocapsae TaxID=34508 RepID=A0A4U5NEJ1_STECR|nr:hypothetical protein L596_014998 [Steinernema carpocapsae]
MPVVEYNALARYLVDHVLEGSAKSSRDSIRRKATNFVVFNGVLFYSKKGSTKRCEVVKEGDVVGVLEKIHVGRKYLGMNALYSDVSAR